MPLVEPEIGDAELFTHEVERQWRRETLGSVRRSWQMGLLPTYAREGCDPSSVTDRPASLPFDDLENERGQRLAAGAAAPGP